MNLTGKKRLLLVMIVLVVAGLADLKYKGLFFRLLLDNAQSSEALNQTEAN